MTLSAFVTQSKLSPLTAWQANYLRDKVLSWLTTIPGSFIGPRRAGIEEVRAIIMQISPGMTNLRAGMC